MPGLGGVCLVGGVSAWSGGCLPGLGDVYLIWGCLPGLGGLPGLVGVCLVRGMSAPGGGSARDPLPLWTDRHL